MEKVEYLPLGSIIVIKGGVRKVVIVARGVGAKINGNMRLFDYSGCVYPDGITGEKTLLFNHSEIQKVIFMGYTDEDEKLMVENINEWVNTCGLEKGDPYELNKESGNMEDLPLNKDAVLGG